jgi:ABC-type nitrate/sulfonate/bicarbonate transport system substrate-binding protein
MFFKKLHHRKEDRAKQRTRKELIHLLDNTYQAMMNAYLNGMDFINNNPELSPQLVEDCLDEDLLEIIRLLVLLKDVVNIAQPGTIDDGGDPYHCGGF